MHTVEKYLTSKPRVNVFKWPKRLKDWDYIGGGADV
jgi:hypothetical protein